MSAAHLKIFESHDELYHAAAEQLQEVAKEAVEKRGRFLLVLSGGSSPRPLFHLLAKSPYRQHVPWEHTHFFWGDERLVPADDPASNYGQAQRLLLEHLPVTETQVHPIPGAMDPLSASEAYARELLTLAAPGRSWPRFDLVFLGLGSDGHTASLFPGSVYPLTHAQPTLAVSVQYEDRPAARVTLTAQVFNDARALIFLVTGSEKAEALAAVLQGSRNPTEWPAQRIRPSNGRLLWLVDKAAASLLQAEP